MNFNFNQNNQNTFEPLSIDTLSQQSINQTLSIWSPFSTPSFSPFASNFNSPFQYSTYSPQNALRPISKRTPQRKNFEESNSNVPFGSNYSNQLNMNNNQMYDFNKRNLPKRSENVDLSETIRQAAIQRSLGGRSKMCTFCKTNGENEEIYSSHSLKDSNDRITCPILLKYSCPVCGASGEKTHTKKYCPQLQKKMRLEMLNKLSNPIN